LTRYPAPEVDEFRSGDFGRATGYFPLVGLIAGLDLLLLRWLVLFDREGLHYPLWCVALLAFWVWSSASLHLDGLADTTDALASRAQGNDFYEVLSDPRNGSFAVMALVLDLLARFAFLYALPMRFYWFLPLPMIASRLLSSLACQVRPYAGEPGSLGSLFIEEARHEDASRAVGWAFASFLLVSLPAVYFGAASAREAGLALLACSGGVLLGWIALRVPRGRLGGISGDLLGWSQEIAELSGLFLLFFLLVRA
jgi:adenosylcobinamide-GDP ribazoletransferase